jgi:hypothetical protein
MTDRRLTKFMKQIWIVMLLGRPRRMFLDQIELVLQELLKSRFGISRDSNFMLLLSVRFNFTATECPLNLILI